MPNSNPPTIVNQNPFANPTFTRHFHEAHAQNLTRALPTPPPPPVPEPHRGRKTFDTRITWRPEDNLERPLDH